MQIVIGMAHDDPEEDGEEMETEDHRLERTPVAAPEISNKAQAGKVHRPWVNGQREEIKWKPPGAGLFKINFDGVVFEELALAGLGVVIRDSSGLIIAALSQKIRLPSSVDMVEVLVARRALSFAQEISIFFRQKWREIL
ncbi:hypothetical protein CFP56_005977 [Quercus suber]|uniref:RNase H type-1 domain-containing protein n=1 Tax=Quercus suber TaxID=58331 RepID=A0AAW0M9Y4_QUESU